MNIAIIGTGNVGNALGKSLTRGGHSVVFYGRDNTKAEQVAAAHSATASADLGDTVRGADVVILAVPYSSVDAVGREIAPLVAGKIVIDATNPLKPDMSGLATTGTSAAEELAALVPGADVVKGFNTLFASVQGEPSTSSQRVDALFATDSPAARETFAKLADSAGFRPVYVGPLAAARELESLALLNIRLQVLTGGAWNTTLKLVDAPEKALAA